MRSPMALGRYNGNGTTLTPGVFQASMCVMLRPKLNLMAWTAVPCLLQLPGQTSISW